MTVVFLVLRGYVCVNDRPGRSDFRNQRFEPDTEESAVNAEVPLTPLWSKTKVWNLGGRNRAIVITESLARVIAAIRITGVRWRSYLPLKAQKYVLVDPAFVALRFEWRIGVHWCSIRSTWIAEWPARVDRVRWTLVIGDWRFGPSKVWKDATEQKRRKPENALIFFS